MILAQTIKSNLLKAWVFPSLASIGGAVFVTINCVICCLFLSANQSKGVISCHFLSISIGFAVKVHVLQYQYQYFFKQNICENFRSRMQLIKSNENENQYAIFQGKSESKTLVVSHQANQSSNKELCPA